MKTCPDEITQQDLFKAMFAYIDARRECEWEEKEIKENLRINMEYCIERYMEK